MTIPGSQWLPFVVVGGCSIRCEQVEQCRELRLQHGCSHEIGDYLRELDARVG